MPGENTTGGDFGIAIKLRDGSYNLIFFQAKQDSVAFDQHRLDINKPPAGYKNGNDISKLGWKANREFGKWCLKETVPKRSNGPSHQIVKLATQNEFPFTNASGTKLATDANAMHKNWTHYVVWLDAAGATAEDRGAYASVEPLYIPLSDVKTHLSDSIRAIAGRMGAIEAIQSLFGNSGFLQPINYIPLTNKCSFAQLLIHGMREGAAGWLQVSLDDAKAIVGHLRELGAQWSFVERSDGQGPNLSEETHVRSCRSVVDQAVVKASAALAASIKNKIRTSGPAGTI